MKRVTLLFFILHTTIFFAQSNQPWRSFFSYNKVVDVAQSGNRMYAAAENAVFSKSVLTNELKTITSVDGLKAETISAIYHSTQYNTTLVGNANGLLLVIKPDNSIVNKIDIVQEATVQPNRKKINHIYEYAGKAYLSCDFGIAVFDLATLEFGDTYYMGPVGSEIPVVQCTVHAGMIYAATPNNGMRRAPYGDPNLNDYNLWSEHNSGPFTGVLSFGGQLFATVAWGTLYREQGGGYAPFAQFPSGIIDIREANGYMVVTAKDRVNIYNDQLMQVLQINTIQGESVNFTCATVVSETLFIGTLEKGVFSASLGSLFFQNITPDGPERSNIFSIEKTANFLWAVFGGHNYDYVPNYSRYGVSKFTQQGWVNIPYEELFGAESLSDIAVNPNNENEVYVASFHSGLLKIENDEPIILYNEDNTNSNGNEGLESLVSPASPGYESIRVNGLVFDRTGNLWMMNTRIEDPLKVLENDGGWRSYSFGDLFDPPLGDEYGEVVIDKNGTKWISSYSTGLIGFNESPTAKFIVINEDGNLPANYIKSLAIDNRNQLWIGTNRGLRVLPSVDRFTTENELTVNSIIIMEDGIAQELMYEQFVSDIEVDGANNKWIGTGASGAFLVSPDGQETIFHFTKENSPLPSNTINDIAIDSATGEVFFATDKGMVSYQGTSTMAEDDLSKVYVFPNPVRPGFEGDVNISGLIDKANIKITDIEGNLVYETTSEGGTVLWDTRAFGRYKVASGVYMIFIASEDATKTKVKKVMIIR